MRKLFVIAQLRAPNDECYDPGQILPTHILLVSPANDNLPVLTRCWTHLRSAFLGTAITSFSVLNRCDDPIATNNHNGGWGLLGPPAMGMGECLPPSLVTLGPRTWAAGVPSKWGLLSASGPCCCLASLRATSASPDDQPKCDCTLSQPRGESSSISEDRTGTEEPRGCRGMTVALAN